MQSLSIIGHPGGRHTIAQQLLAHSHFQSLGCADLEHEQSLQAVLRDNDHVLLVYCSPGLALARALEQDSEADRDHTLQNWSDKARTLLRHFMLNRERCTLVNELALLHTPNQMLAALASKTGQYMASEPTAVSESTTQPLLEALGTSLAYADQHSAGLYRDLETVADVNGDLAVRQHLASLRAALLEITAKLAEPQSSTEPPASQTAAQPDEKIQELQEENELLLLQLHQVQEELEHYFCEYQKLSEAAKATSAATTNIVSASLPQKTNSPAASSAETLFDLREEHTIGVNWYDAEHDGRWAGPGTESTLILPAVGQGRFELIFDIVHALDSRIVKNMQILLNDAPLKLKHKFGILPFKRFPCQVRTQIDTSSNAQQTPWTLRFRFPHTISPAEKGNDDHRQLAMRLRAVRVRALAMPQPD